VKENGRREGFLSSDEEAEHLSRGKSLIFSILRE
jgi:hypothetical protein